MRIGGRNHDITITLMAPNDTDGLENNGKQEKSHNLCNKAVVISNTHAAFIAVFHGPAISSTGGYERYIFT